MTYWYPGLLALLKFLTTRYPKIPIYIGGIYVKLCYKHLKNQIETYFSDHSIYIVNENHDKFLEEIKNKYQPSGEPYPHGYPIFDLQNKISYVVIMTSYGCPFNCPYCASKRLYPKFKTRNPKEVFREILFWHTKYGVKDFAFYDDALLFNFESHLAVILEKILSHNLHLRFHTPNAIHARFVTKEVAQLLKNQDLKL